MTQPISEEEFMKLPEDQKNSVLEEMKFMSLSPAEQDKVIGQLRQKKEQEQRPGAVETAARSFAQGATFNFADEIEGVVRGGIGAIQGENFGEAREKATKESRERLSQGRADFPAVATAAEVGGGLATLALPGGAAAQMGKLGAKAALKAGTKAVMSDSAKKRFIAKGAAEAGKETVKKAAQTGLARVTTEAGKTVLRAGAGGLAAGVGEHGIDTKTLEAARTAGVAQTAAIIAGSGLKAMGKSTVGVLTKVALSGGKGLVGALGSAAGTKLGKGLIENGGKILEKQGKKSAGFVKMVKTLHGGVEKLGNNADKLITAALEGGAPGLAAAHVQLIQQDKDYRKVYE